MKLGPYELEGAIGEGGAGIVYRGRAPDGTRVAVKLLRRHDEAALARFDRERRVQRALGAEDGFVPLIDWGFSPRGPYLVMPFMPGGTLRDRLDRGKLSLQDTVNLGLTVAQALAVAHAQGVAHRDLKPENVVFAEDGSPLVTDLGLAKHFAASVEESLSLSRTGAFIGSAGYAPPEQIKDAKSAGPKVDVFALGAILWECLAGEPAFYAEGFLALVQRVQHGPPPPIATKRPDTPVWLARVIEKAIALDPAQRFEDGDELAAALEAGEWGIAPGARARKKRLPPPVVRPPDEETLSLPPSTAIETAILDGPPIDAANIVAEKPDDAPLTLKMPVIPFTIARQEVPPEKPEPPKPAGKRSSERRVLPPTVTRSEPPAPAPRWRLLEALGALIRRLRGA